MRKLLALILCFILMTTSTYAGGIDIINDILSKSSHKDGYALIQKALGKEDKEVKIIKDKQEVSEIVTTKDTTKYKTKDVLLGIDISKWNGNVNWKEVKEAGVEFVIIRAGYGTNYVDPYFEKNIENAIDNNMIIGVYWFSYAHTNQQAHLEAKKCYKTIKKYKKHITLPVFWDFEYDSVNYANKNGHSISKKKASNMADTFCTTIKSYDMESGIYTNIDYSNRYFTKEVLSKYHTWIAQWTSECTYKEYYIIWQCSDSFNIGGKLFDKNYLYYNQYLKDISKGETRKTITVQATAYSGDSTTSTLVKPKAGRTVAVDP